MGAGRTVGAVALAGRGRLRGGPDRLAEEIVHDADQVQRLPHHGTLPVGALQGAVGKRTQPVGEGARHVGASKDQAAPPVNVLADHHPTATVMFSVTGIDRRRFLDYVAENPTKYKDWGLNWDTEKGGKEDELFSPYLAKPFDWARAEGVIPAAGAFVILAALALGLGGISALAARARGAFEARRVSASAGGASRRA